MDLAPYHRERVPETVKPKSKSLKAEFHAWFKKYGHHYEPSDTVKKLKERAATLPDTTLFALEEEANRQGHHVLWLPPKHCDLNPIELIWADIKHYVAVHNKTYRMADVFELTKEGFQKVTAETWRKACEHVEKIEKLWWKAENLQPAMEPIVINLGEMSDEELSDEEENVECTC